MPLPITDSRSPNSVAGNLSGCQGPQRGTRRNFNADLITGGFRTLTSRSIWAGRQAQCGHKRRFFCSGRLPAFRYLPRLLFACCRRTSVSNLLVLRAAKFQAVDVRRNDDGHGWPGDSSIRRHRGARLVEVQRFHLAGERVAAPAQQFCRFLPVPVRLAHGDADERFLEFGQRTIE